MIKNIKHKGLKLYFQTGKSSGLEAAHLSKLRNILGRLAVCTTPEQMDLPGLNLHGLKGKLKGFYALKVSGHWRLIFKFDGKDVIDVDYLDYH